MVWAADRIVCCMFCGGAVAAVVRKAMVGPPAYGYRISPLCCSGGYAAGTVGGRNAEPAGAAAMSVGRDVGAKCAAV